MQISIQLYRSTSISKSTSTIAESIEYYLTISDVTSFLLPDFFTSLLDDSKDELHEMFTRTYGILYEQNSEIFMDLFRDLRAYYKGRNMNLLEVLDSFFTDLLERMFVLLHSDFHFDDTYLECITDKMNELRPFGDVPQKLSVQVKNSFIAARTFVLGLQVGRDAIVALSGVSSIITIEFRLLTVATVTMTLLPRTKVLGYSAAITDISRGTYPCG